MDISLSTPKRFQVALSFAGEHRAYVESVALELQRLLNPTAVFYDNFYIYELARPDLDTYLLKIYREQSELVVVFLCEAYSKKEWCGLEWRAVRDMIKAKQMTDIMPFVIDQFDLSIEGFLSIDGYIRVDDRPPAATADLIVRRLEVRHANAHGKAVVEIVLDRSFDTYTEAECENVARLIRALIQDNQVRIFSKRRGSVILTVALDQQQFDRLLKEVQAGALDDTGVLEVRRAGEPVFRAHALPSPGAYLPHPAQDTASPYPGPRDAISLLLSSLLMDLHQFERTGISMEQCGMIKRTIARLANIASAIPADDLFTGTLYRELEKFESLYGRWNDVVGMFPEAGMARARHLQALRRSRHKVMRKARNTYDNARHHASSNELVGAQKLLDGALLDFREIVNVGQGHFSRLQRACSSYVTRNGAMSPYH